MLSGRCVGGRARPQTLSLLHQPNVSLKCTNSETSMSKLLFREQWLMSQAPLPSLQSVVSAPPPTRGPSMCFLSRAAPSSLFCGSSWVSSYVALCSWRDRSFPAPIRCRSSLFSLWNSSATLFCPRSWIFKSWFTFVRVSQEAAVFF